MALVADECICLRKFEYSETSQILTLLARGRGLLRVIAKGAHRKTKAGASKFGGGIDLLERGQAVFTDAPEKDLATLTEWKLSDGHLDLRRNLRSIYIGCFAAELIIDLFQEHDAHPDLYDRLSQTLGELSSVRVEETFLSFQLDALREAGYLPELEACVSCGRVIDEDRTYFSPQESGIICRTCAPATPDRMEMDVRLLRILRGILRLPRSPGGTPQRLPKLTRHQTDPLNRLLISHVEQTLSRRLRMSNYILPPYRAAMAYPVPR